MAKKRIIENGLTECVNCGKMLSEDSFYKSKVVGLHPHIARSVRSTCTSSVVAKIEYH